MKRLLTAAFLCLLLLAGLSLTTAAQTRATVTVRLVETLSTCFARVSKLDATTKPGPRQSFCFLDAFGAWRIRIPM
jgi:hypothetical protein